MSLLERGRPGRQLVVVVYTDGRDNGSLRSLADVTQIARRTDAILYIALVPGPPALPLALAEAAMATGGTVYDPGRFDSVSEIITRVLDDFRTRYVLFYAPEGVPRLGWHEVVVRVKNYTVRARRGYFVDARDERK
jgi:hypothetical protein